ncbi:hypothetical protein [Methylophaga thalassica]|uniref:hypothetical protein n=1 Tax=Methylophaga aminisulfidivorans TaxID=230105 RepID=UPI0024E2016D|nr:hypothetical protein [Methylophaga aminisulfidivorans]
MKENKNKPFIPKDKPRSWDTGVLAALIAVLLAGPIMFIGTYLQINFIKSVGIIIFVLCWIAFFLSWLIFVFGLSQSKYQKLTERPWSEQVW